MLKRFLSAVLLVVVAASAQAAGPKPLPPFKLSPSEYIPVSQVRPGMTGYGLTVFKGVKISKFGVKVIGVMPQGDMGRPLVLVMLSGGPITKRQANLIQGMSGSPIYIGGRLLGAFALGESTGREPIGMVRPIEDMVDAFDPRLPSRPVFASAPDAPGTSLTVAASGDISVPGLPGSDGDALFRPLPVPVIAAGASPRTVQILNETLKPFGLRAMAGPGGGGGGTDNPSYFPRNVKLEPGSSIAVSLVQGDVDVTAIGTVTYRKGNRILAFGHPFLQIGPAEYPASTAYIHEIFSSIVVSHKYGSPIETVGTIQQDGPFSVGGLLHRLPHMVPMTVHVSDASTGRRKDFKVRMVNHPTLLPGLILSAAQEVVGRVRTFPGEAMAKVTYTIVPEGYAPITRTNTFFDAANITTAAMQDVSDSLFILSRNPFEPVPIKRVDISVDMMNGHRTATVQRTWVERNKVEPGDTVNVQAIIKPYKGAVETRALSVKIPENAPAGAAQIVVYGGQTGFGTISASAAPPSGSAVSTSSMAVNVKQLITKFQERAKNDELGVTVLLPGSAVSVDGEKLSSQPETLAAVMKSTKASNTRLERDEVRLVKKMPYVIAGAQVLNLTIEKKSAVEKASSPSTAAAAGATTDTPDASDSSDEPDATSAVSATLDPDEGDSAASILAGALPDARAFATAALISAGATRAAAPAEEKAPAKDEAKDDAKADAKEPAKEAADAKTDSAADVKTVDASEAKDDSTSTAKGPGRVAKAWKQVGKETFEAGKLTHASVSSSGDVLLTPTLESVSDSQRPYVWALLPLGDGSVLAGTGNAGEVLKVSASGKTSVFASTGDLEVHALSRDAQGNVYAGTSPRGRILRINASGKASPFFDTGEKYILALAVDAKGNLYAGTGPDGKLYVVTPDGKGRELLRLPEAHVMALAVAEDGAILAGTAPDGLLYRISPDGQAKVLFDAPEGMISGVAVETSGDVVVATAPKGKVYRVHPDGRGETLLDKTEDSIMALVAGDNGTLYAAGGHLVYAVAPDKTVTTLDNDDQNQIVSLAVGPDGALWAGSANTGIVYRAAHEKTGSLLSSIHDAGLRAQWGRLEWLTDVPDGGKLEIQTRSGNVAQPDTTWSDWSEPVANGAAAPVKSPPARFIQYRVSLTAAPDGDSPTLHWVSMRYLTENRPPTVKFTDPKEGDRWNGKKTVKWTGSDPDTDTLTYTLYASPDNGTTWTVLNTQSAKPAVKADAKADGKSGAKTDAVDAKADAPKADAKDAATKAAAPKADAPKNDAEEKAKQDAKDAETAKKVESELGKVNDLSPEMRDSILQTAKSSLSASTKVDDNKADSGPLSKTSFSWDTSTEKDGVYRLKVVATDKASNPGDPLSDEDVSGPVVVVNAKPNVKIADADTKVGTDRVVTLQGTAQSPEVAILGVSYRVDGGDWKAAIPADGIFDSPEEAWKVTTDPLDSGEHAIEVRVNDEVDNNASATKKVTIP